MNVKMPTGQTIRLLISPPLTIENVKQEISKEEGILPHCQQLTVNERVLEDGHTFNDCDIHNVDLMVRGSKYMY